LPAAEVEVVVPFLLPAATAVGAWAGTTAAVACLEGAAGAVEFFEATTTTVEAGYAGAVTTALAVLVMRVAGAEEALQLDFLPVTEAVAEALDVMRVRDPLTSLQTCPLG
jgi:hypothetical protein